MLNSPDDESPNRRALRKILLIAQRDYIASVRTKAFLFGIVMAPVMFAASFLGVAILKVKPDVRDRRVAIVDPAGTAAAAIIQAAQGKNAKDMFDEATGRQVAPHYIFEAITGTGADPNIQRLELSNRVRRGDLYMFLEIGPESLHPGKNSDASRVDYYTNSSGIDATHGWFNGPVNDGLRRVRLAQLGIDERHYESLFAAVPLERMDLISKDEKTGKVSSARKKNELDSVVPLVLFLMLGMMVLMGATPMLSSIAEDKGLRVFELLLGAATPFELMAGKVVAAVGRSFTGSVFYVLGGLLALQIMATVGVMPLHVLPWFFVYLAADVTMVSAMAAALGAAVSSPQEAQSLVMVLISPIIFPFILMAPIMQQPNGAMATAMSFVPPITPMLMLLRQSMPGGVPWWQPWAGLLGILAFTIVAVWAAARIFRVTILLQGKTPKAADLVRWAVRG